MTIRKWAIAAAIAALFASGSSAGTVEAAAQSAPPPPALSLVPAMPAACFADDGFDGRLIEAQNAAIAAKDRQEALNARIREQFDGMDMMEKARRMQDWMMKNPDAASKMLQASANAGDAAAATTAQWKASGERLDRELQGHKKAFDTAVDGAVKPVEARIDALIQAKARKTQVDAVFTTDADYAAYVALVSERNAAYEKACAPFFGAGGTFHRWLAAHRSEITEKQIAAEESGNATVVQQFAIMDTPSGGYRLTGGYDVVREHLRRMSEVVGYRRYKTTPQVTLKPR
jgi:hypothetical protein